MRRYILVTDLYIYADNDHQAMTLASQIVDDKNENDDCQAAVIGLLEQPPATLDHRLVIGRDVYAENAALDICKQIHSALKDKIGSGKPTDLPVYEFSWYIAIEKILKK